MTIGEAIEAVRRIKSGYDISDEEIIAQINRAELEVIENVIRNREGDNDIIGTYGNYSLSTDRDYTLLVPAPYDRMYEAFCAAHIDGIYEEADRYAIDMSIYNGLRDEFAVWWIKNHAQKKRYNFHI